MNASHRRSGRGKFVSIILAVAMVVTAVGVASASSGNVTSLANRVVGWGFNGYCCPYEYLGQATPPTGLTDVVAIAAGDYYSLALRGDGTVVGWGDNGEGQASPPATLTDAVAVAAGTNHSLALRSDGTVVGWGFDEGGEASPPATLTDAIAIAAGANFSLALRRDGTVVSWGEPGRGTPPAGLTGVVAISAGSFQSLALRGDGTVIGWGTTGDGTPFPTPPAGLTDVVAVDAGSYHNLALRGDGTVVGWGDNRLGQTTPPVGLNDAVAIAAGWGHSLALRSDGTVVGWGQSADGRTTPPLGLAGATAIAAGQRHSLAIASVADVVELDVLAGPAGSRTLVYSRGPVTLTSGDYVVDPVTGHVTSITGTGTLAGQTGSTVTFDISYRPATLKYEGTVIVSDPMFNARIPVRAWRFGISRSADSVSGTLYGIKTLSTPQRCFKIDFRIDDLG